MDLGILPLEERIVLDAAGAADMGSSVMDGRYEPEERDLPDLRDGTETEEKAAGAVAQLRQTLAAEGAVDVTGNHPDAGAMEADFGGALLDDDGRLGMMAYDFSAKSLLPESGKE